MVSSHAVFSVAIGFSFLVAQATLAEAQILPSLAPPPTGGVQQAGGAVAAGEASGAVKQTAWPKITMPKVTMPKVTMPDLSKVLSPVSVGFEKVSTGSKKAWEGTKEMFSFGKTNNPAPVSTTRTTQPQQSIWNRLTGRAPEPVAPQTVGEWMSQPRLDP
jgi:hypothetical protein